MTNDKKKLLLFGASGSVGSAIHNKFLDNSWEVIGVTRGQTSRKVPLFWYPLDNDLLAPLDQLKRYEYFDAVCWAQGQNCNDSIYNYDEQMHREVYEANVIYILNSLSLLLENGLLRKPAKLCVISSIWQNLSRQNKLSYGVSKAAIQGLILSVANDIGVDGHLINAILPGALDTPMTHKNLTKEQMSIVVNSTQFGRLANLGDVANTAYFLCSPENTGITGQFIKVDLGYSDVRVI
jgi:NAD(P)-dependent dehydrogenase (short-subunit alcohol dehydrogenase family)